MNFRRHSTSLGIFLGATIALVASACSFDASTDEQSSGLGEAPGLSLEGKAPAKPVASTPTLSATSATQTTISIQVCAGATGAPAGFSVQWMTAADFATSGWQDSDAAATCAASFGGNANGSRFPLAPFACTTVDIGNLFDEEPGVSFTCNDDLLCGTDYVFRAFAHGDSTLLRSAFTPTLTASTAACSSSGCTFTQGYWKTHCDTGATDCHTVLAWPVTSLTLGSTTYTNAQLESIFTTPAGGNGLIALAHQLIAAKLNIASGADGSAVSAAIASADALIAGLIVPPVGSGYLSPSVTSSLVLTLTAFNEGTTGPGHCAE
ncbi:MAG TPA: hypothetical protein VGP93_16170 [Polyangiaceae bacterium]|jgi:hypothetical protein|nr:hypothetical protein [Polyangiaceae bacterium]